MTEKSNKDTDDETPEEHVLEIVQRLRENFASSDSEHGRHGLELLDELEEELRSGDHSLGNHNHHHNHLRRALGHAEQSLLEATRPGQNDDLFHRTMHSLEAAIVDLETILPVAARVVRRIAGVISHIGL